MKILHIDTSPRPESHSRELSALIVAQLSIVTPWAEITYRDLGLNPIPHTEAAYATVLSSPAALTSEQALEAVELSEQLIQEIEEADAVVIGTPVNNFTVSSVLKAWIDQILRMNRTIGVSASGEKLGLLHDKPVYICIASGGFFTGEHANQPDFIIPYLTAALGCVGLTSLEYFPLQGTAFLNSDQLTEARRALVSKLKTGCT